MDTGIGLISGCGLQIICPILMYDLMHDEPNIKAAQYLTVLPDKQWFIDKLNRSILIARELKQQ